MGEGSLKLTAVLFFTLVQIVGTIENVKAQNTFEKSFGYDSLDEAHSVKQTLDGGYLIAGYTVNYLPGLGHDYVARLNSYGDTLWTKSYGTQYDQSMANALEVTSDNGFIFTGYAQPYSGNGYLYLVRADEEGDTIWTRKISSGVDYTCGYSVQQTDDGGYIVCGIKNNVFSTASQILLVKTDAYGNQQWTKDYGGSNRELGSDVTQTKDGGYIIVGASQSFGAGDWDFYVVKTDAAGNSIWENHYGDAASDLAYSIKQTADSSYVILGESEKIEQNQFVDDFFLIKINSVGDTLWTRKYPCNVHCADYSLDLGCDDGYVLAGAKLDSSSIYPKGYLIKTDDLGNVSWTKTFGDSFDGRCFSVARLSDGYVVAGFIDSSGDGMRGEDVFVAKTNTAGDVTVTDQMNPQNNSLYPSPNPFSMSTVFHFNEQVKFGLQLYDVVGNPVFYCEGISNQLVFQRGSLPGGIYFFKLNLDHKRVLNGSLVVE